MFHGHGNGRGNISNPSKPKRRDDTFNPAAGRAAGKRLSAARWMRCFQAAVQRLGALSLEAPLTAPGARLLDLLIAP